jgi:ATP-dependent Clp protease ATP-binding subunit ClpA
MSDDIKARLTELKERLNRTSDLVGDAEVMLEEAEIAMTIEKITGIPVAKMVGDEKQKIMEMEQILKERLIGQDGAIETIAEAVRKSRAGLKRANRPIGSFLFLGPTGVGKTYLAKLLAEFLFNDPSCMIRMDMSEYMEKHNVAKMVGAPAGYVGYEEGGILTDYVRMKPFSVVLQYPGHTDLQLRRRIHHRLCPGEKGGGQGSTVQPPAREIQTGTTQPAQRTDCLYAPDG